MAEAELHELTENLRQGAQAAAAKGMSGLARLLAELAEELRAEDDKRAA